jgi:hypothetical protein
VRQLAQSEVLKSASIAALLTSLACYPRLSLWPDRHYPLWYLEALLFLGGMVLWAFVFGWHTKYTHRLVFTRKLEFRPFLAATVAGICLATGLRLFVDPPLRLEIPEDYPGSLDQWIAMTLFTLTFSQLFLVFAPFAWLVRLFHSRRIAIPLTVLFGVCVLMAKTRSAPMAIPPGLSLALVIVRVVAELLSLYFYLRGGVLLVWWWGFLLQARHLPGLATRL